MSNINVNNLTPLLGSGSSVSISGSLVVKNDVTIGGHLYIGDANTDSVTFSAEVSSSVVPDANITYDLGSSAKKWKELYLNSLVVKHITASGNISASGTGVNGTGSFHHMDVNGNITASGTGSFQQGVTANQSSSFTYISMSGALKTAYHVSASKLQLTETAEIYGSASMGYISSSGDLTASGTGSFGGGIDSSTATGSFGQVTAVGDVSSSGTGSFMDVFIDDNLEVQGVTNIHGNISSSNNVTASFGYISSSGDLNIIGQISASRVSASNGFEADTLSTSSFGNISASGNISTSAHMHAVQYFTDSLIFATGNQAINTVKLGGASSVTQLHGLSIDVSGSISMSGDMTLTGDISSSGRISASGGFETDAGTTSNFGNISMSGALTLTGDVSASRVSASAGFEADSDSKSTFGHISMSGDLQIGNNTVVISGSIGEITASGNISGGAQIFGGDYYAQGLQFATQADSQTSGVLQIGGSAPMRITGTSLMVTGSVSMSGALSMSGANSDLTIDQGNIAISNGYISTTAGSISSSEHIIGNLIQQHTAGVTNFAVDALGQVTASGQISSSAGLAGTALTLTTAGVHKASIDASGNIAAEGYISSSGLLSATSLDIKSAGVAKADIDADGNITSVATIQGEHIHSTDDITADGIVSSSAGISIFSAISLKANGVSTLDLIANGVVSASGVVQGTAFRAQSAGVDKFLVDTSGNVAAEGYVSSSGALYGRSIDLTSNGENFFNVTAGGAVSGASTLAGTALTLATNGVNAFTATTAGAISASSTIAGTALTLATAGTTYATIDALGTGSFLGGIDAGSLNTISSSFGYISASADISTSGAIYGETLIVGAGNSIFNGNVKFNGGIARPIKSITADTVLDATAGVFADAGKTIVLNKADGAVVTLPAAQGTGNEYKFYVGTAITSNSYVIKVADATDTFIGAVHMMDADDDSQTSITAKGTDDTLTMNGGTTGGGLLGDTLTFTDIATNKYVVQGNIIVPAGSNPTDPFSATV
jgi:hypothetical protein